VDGPDAQEPASRPRGIEPAKTSGAVSLPLK
jgi:hypothetical protein